MGYIDPIHEPLDEPLYMGSYIHQQFDNCGEVEKDDLLLMQGCASSFSLGKNWPQRHIPDCRFCAFDQSFC